MHVRVETKVYMQMPQDYLELHEGNVSFISKTQLVQHYIESLGAIHFGGRLMIIDTNAALRLLNKYFPK